MGRTNRNRGAKFETYCALRPYVLDLNLIVKRIERHNDKMYQSLPDIEFCDFKDLMVDCKFTEGDFSVAEKKKLVIETYQKYAVNLQNAVVITGEKRGKTRLSPDNINACRFDGNFLHIMPYDDFLKMLHNVKSQSLKGQTTNGLHTTPRN